MKYCADCKEASLEANPERDAYYYDKTIEEHTVRIKMLEKIADTLLKLM